MPIPKINAKSIKEPIMTVIKKAESESPAYITESTYLKPIKEIKLDTQYFNSKAPMGTIEEVKETGNIIDFYAF